MIGKLKKGRFFLEYAALTAIIVIAVLGMQTYLRRAFSVDFGNFLIKSAINMIRKPLTGLRQLLFLVLLMNIWFMQT